MSHAKKLHFERTYIQLAMGCSAGMRPEPHAPNDQLKQARMLSSLTMQPASYSDPVPLWPSAACAMHPCRLLERLAPHITTVVTVSKSYNSILSRCFPTRARESAGDQVACCSSPAPRCPLIATTPADPKSQSALAEAEARVLGLHLRPCT